MVCCTRVFAVELLFLMDLDPVDLPFALEASKDSEEESGSGNGSEGSGSEDGDAMME
jgi:hypothetical protein